MNGRGGHLYMQTNEVKNAVMHYHRSANGTLTEVERVATGGAGSGTFKPISGQESAPNAFEGAASVILSPDRVSVCDERRRQFGLQLRGRQGRPAHTAGHQADRECRGGKERHRQVVGLCPVEWHALRAALVRSRPSPADVGRQ